MRRSSASIFGSFLYLLKILAPFLPDFMPTEGLGNSYLHGSLPWQCLPVLTGLAGTYHCSHWFAKQHIVNNIDDRLLHCL